jgi:hypothetical protein
LQLSPQAFEYVRAIGHDPLIHREVARVINGLVDFLKVERRKVQDTVIYEASPLERVVGPMTWFTIRER